ncbi:glycosyltransferase family 2 protein [Asticcacaulis machinosus]|uniref:Glycosyltransferase family 2 protein n=1 Tax=Asticcacaulis machinosus TaxID=2984211 RepID=A0ABT5HJT5_9CAUL|nr:glycosyltransferase family 2 protein [Asticcacaulis machinosus]MDC7676501.1 glycosyltransferase family 2 protein [Asticcacaulis machinosus]
MFNTFLRKLHTVHRYVIGFFSRLMHAYWLGASAKRQTLFLTGQVFDWEWYVAQYPELNLNENSAVRHFFFQGIDQERVARFFDARWYLANSSDIGPLSVDAYAHYLKFGRAERRPARFFYVNSSIYTPPPPSYAEWLAEYESPSHRPDAAALTKGLDLHAMVCISLVVPFDSELRAFNRTLVSVQSQSFVFYEIVIGLSANVSVDVRDRALAAAVQDNRIRIIELPDSTLTVMINRLAEEALYPFFTTVPLGDEIHPDTMMWLAVSRRTHIDAVLFYGDEDEIHAGRRENPYFKPQLNYELLLTHDYIGRFTTYDRQAFLRVGGFDTTFANLDEAQYDLAFRIIETFPHTQVVHIPRILYHRHGPRVTNASPQQAVEKHLARTGRADAQLMAAEVAGYSRVRFALPEKLPLVSIIIPTRDRPDLLKTCLSSLLEKTTYRNYEILVIDNGSVEAETLEYLEDLELAGVVRVLRDPRPFNYSALNNAAVREATGEFICLMNNDIEILTWDWLEEMVSFAAQPDVGCVGARLWYPDGRLQHAGVLLGYCGAAGHVHKLLKKGDTGRNHRAALHQSLSAVTAACLLVKRRIFEEVGGLDESLAVAFNDVDFCLKVRDAGYRNVYTPYAEMAHHESASRGKDRTREQKARDLREVNILRSRYGESLMNDPAYNPNLTLSDEDMSFAFPPRLPGTAELLQEAGSLITRQP